MIKVQKDHGEGQCMTCGNANIIRMRGNHVRVHCNEISKIIPYPVEDCSMYRHKNQPERYDLEKIAWTLNTSEKKGVRIVGFTPPKKPKEY